MQNANNRFYGFHFNSITVLEKLHILCANSHDELNEKTSRKHCQSHANVIFPGFSNQTRIEVDNFYKLAREKKISPEFIPFISYKYFVITFIGKKWNRKFGMNEAVVKSVTTRKEVEKE